MTTAELATALPEIVTEQVPGPKIKKKLLDRRGAAIPKSTLRKNISDLYQTGIRSHV